MVSNIHDECSFCASTFFKDIPDGILKCVRLAYPWDTTEYTPILIGVPPHVLLVSEMEILRQHFDNILKVIKSNMNKILEKRGVGGNQFCTNAILGDIEESKNKIFSVMNNVTTINGNEDVLPKDEEREDLCLIDEGLEVGELGTEEVHINQEVQLVMDQSWRATNRRVMNRRNITVGFHRGRLQVLPPTWKFPIMTCKKLIDNWYVGS